MFPCRNERYLHFAVVLQLAISAVVEDVSAFLSIQSENISRHRQENPVCDTRQITNLQRTSIFQTKQSRNFLLEATSSSSSVPSESDTTVSDAVSHQCMSLPKPMGLVFEENDNQQGGVHVIQIADEGAAKEALIRGDIDLCIHDQLSRINDQNCEEWTFEQVMDALIDAASPVSLEFTRPEGLVAVCFAQNGVALAVEPGTPICNVAWDAGTKIPFECRSGCCGTCEQVMILKKNKDDSSGKSRKPKYIRPCVAKVPKDASSIMIISPQKYTADIAP